MRQQARRDVAGPAHGRTSAPGRPARPRRFPDVGRRRRVPMVERLGGRANRRLLHADRRRPVRLRSDRRGQRDRATCTPWAASRGPRWRSRRCRRTARPPTSIREIFRGGAELLNRAGVSLLGGHTVTDPEIKFGYSITGEIDPDRVITNATARVGDVLVLTKPLGTGIIVRATKFGQGKSEYLAARRGVDEATERPRPPRPRAASIRVTSARVPTSPASVWPAMRARWRRRAA